MGVFGRQPGQVQQHERRKVLASDRDAVGAHSHKLPADCRQGIRPCTEKLL